MKMKDLREKSVVERTKLLGELRNRVRDLRFRLASRELTDVREIREARKTIAQLLTISAHSEKK